MIMMMMMMTLKMMMTIKAFKVVIMTMKALKKGGRIEDDVADRQEL